MLEMQRFQPLFPIAAGAMGTVHLAHDSQGSEQVVIKRLHRRVVSDVRARAAFTREAMCLCAIGHENVVRFVDFDMVKGVPQLVMEHVEGTTLAKLALGGRRLAPSVVMGIALQLCAGLEAIQAATDEQGRALGIVHRDLSPQNVMVDVAGAVRIIDFGVARFGADEDPGLFGKLTYMAPETLTTGIATSASDLFALAVVMWEMFAGRRFDDADVPSLRLVVGEHARALDRIFARALDRSPAKRFASVADLRSALEKTGIVPAARAEIAAAVGQAGEPVAARSAPRTSWAPFDVDRPTRSVAAAELENASPSRFLTAVKWAGILGLAMAVASATNAIVELADEAPVQAPMAGPVTG